MTRDIIGNIRDKARQRFAAVLAWRPADRRWFLTFLGLLAVTAGLVVAVTPAHAFDLAADVVWPVLGFIIESLVSLLGQLLLLIVGVLMNVAQYNHFVDAPIVGTGWVIVRDVVNMFFIVVLLVLAFGTILGVQSYSIKGGNLTRLLIMAIVINFSRTICGVMIDFGQVVMLTFVSGFKDAAGGNFVEAMKINEILQNSTGGENVSAGGTVIALMLAVVMVAIATFVVIMMTVALTIRIVYLWLLVILSPIAFFLKAVPGGSASKAYADWWSKFTSNLLFGPVMAFFLWLTLVTVQQSNLTKDFKTETTGESISDSVSAAFNTASLQTFVVAVCLLLGGYQIAMELGGSTTGMANKAVKKVAGEAYKRTGLQSYMNARKQAAEEKYAARGAKIGVGVGAVQLATSKVLGAPGAVISGGIGRGLRAGAEKWGKRDKDGKLIGAGGFVKTAGESVGKRGLFGAIAAAPGQGVKRLGGIIKEKSAVKEGEGRLMGALRAAGRGAGAGVEVAGGAVQGLGEGLHRMTSPARIMAESGRSDYNRGRDYKYKQVQQAQSGLANRTDKEVMALAEGKVTGAKPAEQQAAIMRLMEKGYTNTPEKMDDARQRLRDTGADNATQEAFDRIAREKFPGSMPPASEFDMARAYSSNTFDSTKMKPEQLKDVASKHGGIAAGAEQRKREERILGHDKATKDPYLEGVREFANIDPEKDPIPGITDKMNAATKSKLRLEFDEKQAAARGTLARMDKEKGMETAYGIKDGDFTGDEETQRKNKEKFMKDMTRPGAQELAMSVPPDQMMQNGAVTAVGQALLAALEKGNNKALSAAPGVSDKTPDQEASLKALVATVMANGSPAQRDVIKGRSFAGVRSTGGSVEEGEEEGGQEPGVGGKGKRAQAEAPPPRPQFQEFVELGEGAVGPSLELDDGKDRPAAASQATAPQPAAPPKPAAAERPMAGPDSLKDLQQSIADLRDAAASLEASGGKTIEVRGEKLDLSTIESRLAALNTKESETKAAIEKGNKPKKPPTA